MFVLVLFFFRLERVIDFESLRIGKRWDRIDRILIHFLEYFSLELYQELRARFCKLQSVSFPLVGIESILIEIKTGRLKW
jgi:hypothetical protein